MTASLSVLHRAGRSSTVLSEVSKQVLEIRGKRAPARSLDRQRGACDRGGDDDDDRSRLDYGRDKLAPSRF